MLPESFLERMKEMLGEEYPAFLASMEQDSYQALRLNPLKGTKSQDLEKLLKECERVPWEINGYYYGSDSHPGKHPYHEAGVYYIQEPSAMMPVPLLEVSPGERVLDLCAAPGGKSTQIAGYLRGEGLLVCNEINPKRAKILSENLERMGVMNACVFQEAPERLSERFVGYFDKILVDAPCSGEGMFRKNEEAQKEWSPGIVEMCAARQDAILEEATKMLKPSGRMVYSTCTFAKLEDEGSIQRFLERHPDHVLLEMKRFWPHKVKGEGHFAAVLQKGKVEDPEYRGTMTVETQKGMSAKDIQQELGALTEFVKNIFREESGSLVADRLKKSLRGEQQKDAWRFLKFGENLYLIPEGMPSVKGFKVLRTGLHIGTFKKNRFEPAHALALSLSPKDVRNVIKLSSEGTQIRQYLNGQTFGAEGENGWALVCVDDYSVGWGKLSGGMLKNHYPKGLRIPQ